MFHKPLVSVARFLLCLPKNFFLLASLTLGSIFWYSPEKIYCQIKNHYQWINKLTRMKSMMSRVSMVWGLWLRCWFFIFIIDFVSVFVPAVVVDVVVASLIIVFIAVVNLSIVVRFLIIIISWIWFELFWSSIFLIIFIGHVFLSLIIILLSFVSVQCCRGPGGAGDAGTLEGATLRTECCEGLPKWFSRLSDSL